MMGLLSATECGEVGGEDGTRPRPCHVHHTTQYLGYRVKVARKLAPNIILCLLRSWWLIVMKQLGDL